MKEKTLKTIYIFCIAIYIITVGYAFYRNLHNQYLGMTFVACVMPFVVPVLLKIFKLKAPLEVYILNIIFMYFASVIGSCIDGYQMPYFDKIVHCFSGVIAMEITYIVYKHYFRNDKRKGIMFVIMNALNASIALLWEFYEYALLVFFQYDAIRHVTTGVHDSLTDMLVAVLGGLILSLYLIHYDQKEESHFFVSIEKKMHLMNKSL